MRFRSGPLGVFVRLRPCSPPPLSPGLHGRQARKAARLLFRQALVRSAAPAVVGQAVRKEGRACRPASRAVEQG